jgi:uncharacterized membrane protein YbhN (UPF0104 family)
MTRRTLKRVLPALVSTGILVWLLRGIDRDALVGALDLRVAVVMGAALLVYGAATLWIEATSIQRLLRTVPADLPLWTIARVKSASYLLAILHYALGAAALSLLLHRRADLPLARAASIVILVGSVDLIAVLLLAGVSTAWLRSGPGVHAGILLAALALFFGGLALLRVPASLGPLERLRELAIFEGLRTVAPARLLELFALRIVFALCFVSVCAATFHAFEVAVPFLHVVPGMLIVALVAALPIAVAGLGTSQAAFVLLFAGYASQAELLAMSLVLSAGLMLLRAGMGLVFAREFTREALRDTRASA